MALLEQVCFLSVSGSAPGAQMPSLFLLLSSALLAELGCPRIAEVRREQNNSTVHVYGHPHIIEDQAELYAHLKTLISIHESQFAEPWPFQLPTDYIERMMKGVVGFSIAITRLEGKFKMSQNRSENERARVSSELRASQDLMLCEVAELVSGVRKK